MIQNCPKSYPDQKIKSRFRRPKKICANFSQNMVLFAMQESFAIALKYPKGKLRFILWWLIFWFSCHGLVWNGLVTCDNFFYDVWVDWLVRYRDHVIPDLIIGDVIGQFNRLPFVPIHLMFPSRFINASRISFLWKTYTQNSYVMMTSPWSHKKILTRCLKTNCCMISPPLFPNRSLLTKTVTLTDW